MIPLSRRAFALGAAALWALPVRADEYPKRPIKILNGFAPGGSTDAVARFYALKLGDVLKTSVVVENKPGAGQMVAIRSLIGAQPDGYTLYIGTGSSFSQGPGVRKDIGYDPLKDFTLIGLVATTPGVIVVSPKLPAGSLRELAALSNAPDARLNYGSSGIGSASHLQSEYLLKLIGARMVHIPYKADADIMRELSVGSIHMGISPVQGALAAIKSGKAKPLAVTGTKRIKSLPDVPSVRESGIKGIESIDPYTYYGLAGPRGLPPAITARLNAAINQVSAMPDVIAHMQEHLQFDPASSTPADFQKYIEDDITKWNAFGKIVKLTD
jgi:tripartite-type tricarboxylate transporter receptor subunit TctC